MVRNSTWDRCIRSVLAAIVLVLLMLSLFAPAITSENASAPDEGELGLLLSDACSRCHNLNRVILETDEWQPKDWMHAFDTMAKSSGLNKAEKISVADYVDTHRQEIGLKRNDRQDKPDSMSIDIYYVLFENRCLVCHGAEMIDRIPEDLERDDLRHIVDRMVKKAPHFLDGINTENIVKYLHRSQSATEDVVEKSEDR